MMGIEIGSEWQSLSAAWLANQLLVRGTLVLGAAWALATLARRRSAAVRYAIWLLALVGLAVGPLAELAGSTVREAHVAHAPVVAAAAGSGSVSVGRGSAASHSVVRPPRMRVAREPVPAAWLWIWGAGVVLLVLRLHLHVRSAKRLTRRAGRPDPLLEGRFAAVRSELGMGRAVALRVDPEVGVPFVIGHQRPVVIVPPAARRWSEGRFRAVMRHELAHVARHDYVVHLFSSLMFALYWACPLVWIAKRRLAREREAACDEAVVAWGTERLEYAQHLLDVARDATGTPPLLATAFAGARTGLLQRIRGIVSGDARPPLSRAGWIGGALAVLLFTVTLSGLAPLSTQREIRRSEALEGLTSPEATVRRHAAWMLGELESMADVDALVAVLGDPHAEVRRMAAWALGEIKDRESGGPLARLLDDPDAGVREVAALSIGEIGAPAGVRPLLAAADRHGDLAGPVRWALHEIGGEPLLREHGLLDGGAAPPDRDVWAGRMPAAEVDGERDVDSWVVQLRTSDAEQRRRAAIELGRLGEERAVEPLLEALNDRVPSVRAAAVWALDEVNPSR